MPLRVLYLDMNSYFASVEQQLRPELRGLPVAVAPVDVDSTCCIAASKEAKKLGVHTGTPVWQARQCNVRIVEARPPKYVEIHDQIIAAVTSCIPVHGVHSIDEISCRLTVAEAEPSAAMKLANQIKQTMRDRVGEYLTASIGLAPNRLLAKVAADMRKPNGLTMFDERDLPDVLYTLELSDLPGIGPRMLKRLEAVGVKTIQHLYELSESELKQVWSGVVGQRWWHWLRGYDLPEPPTRKSTVSHSHVLPPDLRTEKGARAVLIRLIHKVAARLRRINYWAGRMEIYVSFTFREDGWSGSIALGSCQDTQSMIEAFNELWQWQPNLGSPTHVAVTLYDLVPNCSTSQPLFQSAKRRLDLARALDVVNTRFGRDMAYFGGMHGMDKAAPTRIAFSQVPDYSSEKERKSFRDPHGRLRRNRVRYPGNGEKRWEEPFNQPNFR